MIYYPEMETERLALRELTLADREAVYNHFSNSEVTRYMDIELAATSRKQKELFNFIYLIRVADLVFLRKHMVVSLAQPGSIVGLSSHHPVRRLDLIYRPHTGDRVSCMKH